MGAPNRGGGDGVLPNPLPGATPRAGFDPASTTIAGRDQAKAAELGASLRTVQTRRATAFCLGSRKPQRRPRVAVTEMSPATLLDELTARDPVQRRKVTAWRDTAMSPPLTPGH